MISIIPYILAIGLFIVWWSLPLENVGSTIGRPKEEPNSFSYKGAKIPEGPSFPRLKEPLLVMLRNGELAEVNRYDTSSQSFKLKGLRSYSVHDNLPVTVTTMQWTLMGRAKMNEESDLDIIALIGEIL